MKNIITDILVYLSNKNTLLSKIDTIWSEYNTIPLMKSYI